MTKSPLWKRFATSNSENEWNWAWDCLRLSTSVHCSVKSRWEEKQQAWSWPKVHFLQHQTLRMNEIELETVWDCLTFATASEYQIQMGDRSKDATRINSMTKEWENKCLQWIILLFHTSFSFMHGYKSAQTIFSIHGSQENSYGDLIFKEWFIAFTNSTFAYFGNKYILQKKYQTKHS